VGGGGGIIPEVTPLATATHAPVQKDDIH
jgi:hypothetical protein